MKLIIWIIFIISMVTPVVFAQETPKTPSALEILEKIDKNMVFQSAYSEVDMIVTVKNRTITKSLISYSLGNQKSFIEFLSPARDKGTKLLKIGDIMKIYYPSAERILRISGHMMRKGMMGSDFSYEDMTEKAKKLREEYDAEVQGIESINGKPCFVLKLTSKIEKQTYFTRKSWVDKERFVVLKEEMYAKSGKLLKKLEVLELTPYDNRFYPTRLTMQDLLRKNSKTEMVVKKIDFDVPIAEDFFIERQLLKK